MDNKQRQLKNLRQNPHRHIVSEIIGGHCLSLAKLIRAKDRRLIRDDDIVELLVQQGELLLESISQEFVFQNIPQEHILAFKQVRISNS